MRIIGKQSSGRSSAQPWAFLERFGNVSPYATPQKGYTMFSDVDGLDEALKNISALLDQLRGKLGDRFLRLELADQLAPRSTPLRVPSGLGAAIDKRIASAGMDALHLFRALRDVNKDVPDNPDKLDIVAAALAKLKQSLVPLEAEVALQIGFK